MKEVEAQLLLFSVTISDEELRRYLVPPSGISERRDAIRSEIFSIEEEITEHQRNNLDEKKKFRQYMLDTWSTNSSFNSEEIATKGGLRKYMSEIDLLLRGTMNRDYSPVNYEF